jgi:hypothetical protein
MKYESNLDINKKQLLKAALENLSSAPSSPVAGQVYFNTTDDTPYIWDGAAWVAMAAGTSTRDPMTKLYIYQNFG